jgi:hypothetical protein
MMNDAFKGEMTRLWGNLGLAAPVFRDQNTTVLKIDDIDVVLTESPDGRCVLATARAGRLSEDPSRRADQIRALLQSNLGALAGNRSCICLDDKDAPDPTVLVRALYPYALGQIGHLKGAIEDVLAMVELHRWSLSDQPPTRIAATRSVTSQPSEAVIFRP